MSFYLMHRGWMENPAFKKEPFTDREAWEWLIQEASFEPHMTRYGNKIIEVSRGQVPTSYRKLKDKFQWGNQRVAAYLAILEQVGMLTRKTGTGFLIITICNYDKYQLVDKNAGTQAGTQPGTVSGTRSGTNIIKINELNEDTTHTTRTEFQKVYEAGSAVFPILATSQTTSIQQWIAAGCSPELDIIPEIERHAKAARNVKSWNFFTGGVMDAKATRESPLPTGNARIGNQQPQVKKPSCNTL